MKFLNRDDELRRLNRMTAKKEGGLAVVWGRRRIGKSRLLLEWVKAHRGLYWVADESAASIQRQYFSQAVAQTLPSFADVNYPDWEALLARLAVDARVAGWRGPLVIDELPYLMGADPAFTSVLQRFIDVHAKEANLVVAVAGSSQRMMHGAALDASAPLYGRASEILHLQPLSVVHISAALGLKSARDAIEAYSLWGGVPRYWELAASYGVRQEEAVCDLVLDAMGVLHDEPQRLLLEELPTATSLRPLLDAIGMGAHRVSEIASRVGQPATALSRPLVRLQELGLVYREVPFGDGKRGGKRALYKLADPFLRLWFRAVAPRRGMLAVSNPSLRRRLLKDVLPALVSETWEELCRRSLPALPLSGGRQFHPGERYWHGQGSEWDVVAADIDNETLLLGEAKWSQKPPTARFARNTLSDLISKGVPPVKRPKQIRYALFLPEAPSNAKELLGNVDLYDAETLLASL